MDQATKYFNRQAAGYLAASGRWPWRWLRQAERAAVLDMMGPVRGAEVLELGCGAGYYTHALLERGARHVWAVDRAPEMLGQLSSPHITPVLGDVATVHLDRSFGTLFAAGVFEFVDAHAVLINAAAMAERNARLAVLYSRPSPIGALFQAFHRLHGVDVRLYTWAQFDNAALATGWSVEAWRPCGLFCIAARYVRTAP